VDPIPEKKLKLSPVTGRGGPCETSRLPHCLDILLTDGGEVVSLTRLPPVTPPGRFLVLISVRGEPVQGYSAAGRITYTEKSNYFTGNRNCDLQTCNST
jgi:hypothetical protein